MQTLPNTEWPLLESYKHNLKLQENLRKTKPETMAPAPQDVFAALRLTPPEKTNVLIVGQDPYINGEAHGLAFSSQQDMTPSLAVIFKELERTGFARTSPDLTSWANQGVLLLNTILTTRVGYTLAHQNYGWQDFTASVVRYLVQLENPLVIMLWGRKAQDFYATAVSALPIERDHVYVLEACHPAAESRGTGCFQGCNHFVDANDYLELHNKQPIQWNN